MRGELAREGAYNHSMRVAVVLPCLAALGCQPLAMTAMATQKQQAASAQNNEAAIGQAKEAFAQMQEQQAAQQREAQAKMNARVEEQKLKKFEAAREADEAAEKEKAKLTASCEQSRPARLNDLQHRIKDWVDFLTKYGAWTRDHCEIKDTRGILVSKEQTGEGVIVRSRRVGQENDVKCNGTLPSGLTQELVGTILQVRANPGTLLLDVTDGNASYDAEDRACWKVDGDAGYSFLLRATDGETIKVMIMKEVSPSR